MAYCLETGIKKRIMSPCLENVQHKVCDRTIDISVTFFINENHLYFLLHRWNLHCNSNEVKQWWNAQDEMCDGLNV